MNKLQYNNTEFFVHNAYVYTQGVIVFPDNNEWNMALYREHFYSWQETKHRQRSMVNNCGCVCIVYIQFS